MRRCSNCGRAVADAARFCGGCGREVPLPAAPAPAPQASSANRFCTSCGAPVPAAARFCVSCGSALGAVASNGRRGASPARIIGAASAGAVTAAVVAAVIIFLRGDGSDDASLKFAKVGPVDQAVVAKIESAFAGLPAPSGANDRDQVRSMMGTPDAFQLSFERSGKNGDGPEVRYETWFYYDLLSAFEFANGKLISNLPIDEVSGPTLLPRRYDPAAFKRSMRWEDTKALLHDPSTFEPRTLPEEFDVPVVFYAGEQLLLAFDDEGLVYVETIPLIAGGQQ